MARRTSHTSQPATPTVRLLPMTRSLPDFADWDERAVQTEFFLKRLPAAGGRFYFPTAAMQADAGTIVLFQYAGYIVARAELIEIERYAPAKIVRGYKVRGAYCFDPSSIRTFDPVDATTLRRVWPTFRRFSHAKQQLVPSTNLAKFDKLLANVRRAV